MSDTPVDAHVRFDTHPAHDSAVTATLTGTHHNIAQALLAARGFDQLDDHTMVLARIDHEEPYWAHQATHALHAEGITTEFTPGLREVLDEEWTWANYPMHWLTRDEIRDVSHHAQQIYDDIRHGRLIIHAHAHDGPATIAIGTYPGGETVALHGENHLRTIADHYESPAQAVASFHRLHGDAVRPGPAPMTDTERATEHARTSLTPPSTPPAPAAPRVETVPAYAADPGDHTALLRDFIAENTDWELYNTWDDNTTIATHETLTLRIRLDDYVDNREPKWTIAAYETPVSERLWHMTLTPATPAPIVEALLSVLPLGEAWQTALGSPVTDTTITEATRPLTDAGWTTTIDGRRIHWQTQQGDVGVQFDAHAAHTPFSTLSTWTLWAGPDINQPTWAIHASAYTPASILADLAEQLAHGTGTRRTPTRQTQHISKNTTTPTTAPVPTPPTTPPASPRR